MVLLLPDEDKDIHVILVDSECAVCNKSVRFIRKYRGKGKGKVHFRSLHSEEGKAYLKKYGFPEDYSDSLVYIHRGKAHIESEAVLLIARLMNGPFPLLSSLLIIPRRLRDPVYRLIARHRHRFPATRYTQWRKKE